MAPASWWGERKQSRPPLLWATASLCAAVLTCRGSPEPVLPHEDVHDSAQVSAQGHQSSSQPQAGTQSTAVPLKKEHYRESSGDRARGTRNSQHRLVQALGQASARLPQRREGTSAAPPTLWGDSRGDLADAIKLLPHSAAVTTAPGGRGNPGCVALPAVPHQVDPTQAATPSHVAWALQALMAQQEQETWQPQGH